MLKHGFLLVVHDHFELLEKIIKLLYSKNHYFFINIDKKSHMGGEFMKECKKKYKNIIFLEEKERVSVNHGGYSQIKVTLILLKKANQANMDYFHLISGQDFPIKSNYKFDMFFEENEGNSYMHFDSEEEYIKWCEKKYLDRVKFFYFKDLPYRNIKLIDKISKYLTKISTKFPIRKDIPNMWGGWSWFSWHKIVVDYVLNQLNENPKFFNRFKYTDCCDEIIFTTLLKPVAAYLNINTKNSLRYIDWHSEKIGRSSNGLRPLILNEEEYNDIVKSDNFFCRKIDPNISKQLIDMLSKNIEVS